MPAFAAPACAGDGGPRYKTSEMSAPGSETPHSSDRISRGLAWVGLASTLVGLLDLGALVILLHFFISPEEYGIATLATALFPVLDYATDLGLSSAVIQRDDHSPDKISTVFWLNLTM